MNILGIIKILIPTAPLFPPIRPAAGESCNKYSHEKIAIIHYIEHRALCIPVLCIPVLGFSQTPQQFLGIYYAYDVEVDSMSDTPAGFEPVYISHYGRHGSRWPVNPKAYKIASDFFRNQQLAQNLTQDGRAAWKLATLCAGNADGHLGELTSIGEQQHHEIASRMASRFPTLFKDNSRIEARSSVEPRCIMSMAAFCESLKDIILQSII